ncbi:MAG: hypothetical protein LM600_02510 [Thaumarchaeota archaeon]|nr:hypothetical protein [Nitrososphaerota archaeon]
MNLMKRELKVELFGDVDVNLVVEESHEERIERALLLPRSWAICVGESHEERIEGLRRGATKSEF